MMKIKGSTVQINSTTGVEEVVPFERDATPEEQAEALSSSRAKASLPRNKFYISMWKAGALTETEALAGSGGEWVDAFTPALSGAGYTADQIAEAKMLAKGSSSIKRNDPILAVLQSFVANDPSRPTISDEQLDSIFGISL